MHITIKNADFSQSGLGNVRWVENYIAAGITDANTRTALRSLYTSFVAAGFSDKLPVFKIHFTTNSLLDSLNMVDPIANAANYQTSFTADIPGAHTLQGYSPLPSTRFGVVSGYRMKEFTNFHMHAWNTTPETAGTVPKPFLGVRSTSSGNNVYISLERVTGFANNSGVKWGTATGSPNLIFSTSDVTATGLYSFSKTNTAVALYDNGSSVYSGTMPDPRAIFTDYTDPNLAMRIGSIAGIEAWGTSQKLFFVGWGDSLWTAADELALNTMLTTFKTAIGA